MDLKHISRFIAWSLFILKESYLVKWPISQHDRLLCGGVSLSIWNSSQLPAEFRNGQLLYLPTEISFTDWRKTRHVSGVKFTNFPGKQQHKLSTRTWSGRASWNRANLWASRGKSKRFFRSFFPSFELGGITKHLVTGPSGNTEFIFSRP